MLYPASAESSSKSRQLALPVLSDTFLSFKDHWRWLSHRVWHYLELAPPASAPRSGDALGDFMHLIQEVCIYIPPVGNCRWYHLSSLENCMDKFTKACKTQLQCAWCKHYVIKRAFPFWKKANHNIRTVIRCKTFQLSNETTRKQKDLL